MNTDFLQNKKIILTGATGGIGRALAARLSAAGVRLLLTARNAQQLEQLAASLPGEAIGLPCDLTCPDQLSNLSTWVDQNWQQVDALIHNAAAPVSGSNVYDIPAAEIEESFATGPIAALNLIREVAQRLPRDGRIILTSSGAGHNGFENMPAYCAAKFALEGIAQAAACDLWKKKICITTVALPSVKTAFSQPHFEPDVFEQFPDPGAVLDPFILLLSPDTQQFSGRSVFLHEHIVLKEPDTPPIRKYRSVTPPLLPPGRTELLAQGYTPDMVKVELGEAPFPPSPEVNKAVTRWMNEPFAHEYPDARCHDLCSVLAKRHGLISEQILPGPGSSEILAWLLDQLVDPGCDVIAGSYCFRIFSWMLGIRGIRQIEYDNQEAHQDLIKILTRITPQTRLIYLDSPSNPMGDVIREQEFRYFLQRLPRHIWVLVDHAYQDFVEESDGLNTTTPEWLSDPRILSVRTLSKSHAMAAWRIGYLAAHPDTIRTITGSIIPFSLSMPTQIAAIAALNDQTYTDKLLHHYLNERKRIRHRLDQLGIRYWLGETSFTAVYWPNVSAIYDQALQEDISIPHPASNLFFIAAIRDTRSNDRVLAFLEKYYPPEERIPPP